MTSLEAEAAVLGAVLINNENFAHARGLRAEHFAQPLHQRIFAKIADAFERGEAVSPVTLRPHFEADPGMQELGGTVYLARLTADESVLLAPRETTQLIIDLAERRAQVAFARQLQAAAADLAQPIAEIDPPRLESAAALRPLDLAALSAIEPPARVFIIPNIAPAKEVTFFTGPGGAGKSLIAQQFASNLAIGRATLGLELPAGAAIYFTCEDGADELHRRQRNLCDALGIDMAELAGKLFLISRRGEADNYLALPHATGVWRPSKLYRAIERMVRRTSAQAVFLDHVGHLFPGDENKRLDVNGFVSLLVRLADDTGAAVILIGHPNKKDQDYSGSTAWPSAVRSFFTFKRPKDSEHDRDARVLSVPKANYGKDGEVLRCRWHNWAFIRDEDLPDDQREQLGQAIAASAENEAFMRCLSAATERRQAVSESPGVNNYGAIFPKMPEGKGYDRAAFERAFQRLLSVGQIELGAKLWQRDNRAWKYGIRAVAKPEEKCTDQPHRPAAPTSRTDPHRTLRRPRTHRPASL